MSKVLKKIKTSFKLIREFGFFNTLRFAWSKIFHTTFIPKIKQESDIHSIRALTEARFRNLQPIPSIRIKREVRRLNVVTDSIASSSLLGGVATALIVATEFARRNNMSLRIITRTEPVVPKNYVALLKNNGLAPFQKVEFYSDFDRDVMGKKRHKLEISPTDVFFATSWWSAAAIQKTTIRRRFHYINQEVETFFYPHGEEHYLCSKLLQDENIDYIINSKYLYDYFRTNAPQVVKNGVYFNPAFSETIYNRKTFKKSGKKYKLFFYARPNNPRNMYYYGLQLIDKAVERGILDTKSWDIYFAGSELKKVQFSNGASTISQGLMGWKEYAEFLSTTDLTISLMYTPHPSYPPYDTACSGGVVLTNRCLNKVEFTECKNIIMTDLEEEKFLDGLIQAVELAKDYPQRQKNFEESSVPRNWNDTLQNTFTFMEERLSCTDLT